VAGSAGGTRLNLSDSNEGGIGALNNLVPRNPPSLRCLSV